MKKLERNIFFHIKALKKVTGLTLEILADLKANQLDHALEIIQRRDELLKVVFDLNNIIDGSLKEKMELEQKDQLLIKAWKLDLAEWSNDQALQNEEIEALLRVERDKITNEIAVIFDKKSRHKGYDLTNVK
ncbi:MAG: hypothetical protein CME70_07050 [Halobacteriovorax sp.]|nr:hypothetical protein [Halobacteriovorax sp.]|tara:strand:- start:433035 stop:433430 length:396 start_codon:yes stop_codon:yes gene_type:complete